MEEKKVYSEVYAVITALNEQYVRKTPQKLLDYFAENRDKNTDIRIDENIPLEEQGLSKETIAILAAIKMDFWADTDDERKALMKLLQDNENK